jgi:hypothetical protein
MSTSAPVRAVHELPETCDSFIVIASGTPAFTTPVVGSDRRSERLSRSSTK